MYKAKVIVELTDEDGTHLATYVNGAMIREDDAKHMQHQLQRTFHRLTDMALLQYYPEYHVEPYVTKWPTIEQKD